MDKRKITARVEATASAIHPIGVVGIDVKNESITELKKTHTSVILLNGIDLILPSLSFACQYVSQKESGLYEKKIEIIIIIPEAKMIARPSFVSKNFLNHEGLFISLYVKTMHQAKRVKKQTAREASA